MSQTNAERPDIPRLPSQISARECPLEKKRQLPRYKVILNQSAIDDLMFVVRSVMELTRFLRADATHKLWKAYHCGRSILITTYLERTGLSVEQFASKRLLVTIVPT